MNIHETSSSQRLNSQSLNQRPKQLHLLRKIQLRQGVKQLNFCQNQQIAVLLTADSILVVNTSFGQITCIIKKLAYPRYVALAKNGKMIVAYYSDNTVTVMDLNGRQLSNVIGVPRSSNIFLISKDCRKIMYGSNQQICLWNIQKADIQVMTRQWKNINCYAISDDGMKFALGTYSGSIFMLTIVGEQKVTEFQIKRHTSCVMCLTFQGNNIASVSYDKVYIQTTIQTNTNKQKNTDLLPSRSKLGTEKSDKLWRQDLHVVFNRIILACEWQNDWI